jgi:hypothetical protein
MSGLFSNYMHHLYSTLPPFRILLPFVLRSIQSSGQDFHLAPNQCSLLPVLGSETLRLFKFYYTTQLVSNTATSYATVVDQLQLLQQFNQTWLEAITFRDNSLLL